MFDGPELILVHGCNAQGVMGSGIAKQIRERYPKAYEEYRKFCLGVFGDVDDPLGCIVPVQTKGRVIINAVTQRYYGRERDIVYVSYDAVDSCMKYIDKLYEGYLEPVPIGMPKIGAGLGNGHWPVIAEIIEYRANNFKPIVYELNTEKELGK